MESSTSKPLFTLTIDPVTKAHLGVTARWARFLAIMGMIVLALGLIVTLMGATVFTTFFGLPTGNEDISGQALFSPVRIGLIIAILVLSVLIFFPLLFLLRFANDMRYAIRANDQNQLNVAFQSLKTCFRYLGILTIIFLVLYAVIITLGVMGLAAAA
jgi:hypothetical protein